jgi:predicted NUDIX family phosphoesterase
VFFVKIKFMSKSTERVLVVPTDIFHEIGVFHGFLGDAVRVDKYVTRLLDPKHLQYRPRSEMETDPSFKQIIPYVVLNWQGQVFHYTRGKKATETRLQALRSIGVGGHISADDSNLFDSPYREAMFREVAEEVRLETKYSERCIGLINDDSTPVGQVHLGIVHVFDLEQPKVESREQALIRSGFAPLAELREHRQEFETWSQFLLDEEIKILS